MNCYIDYLDSKNKFRETIVHFKSYQEAQTWMAKNLSKPHADMIKYSEKYHKALKLWAKLGDIPVDEDDNILEPFLDFEIGTDKFEIWHWFEDSFDLSVAKDLMGLD